MKGLIGVTSVRSDSMAHAEGFTWVSQELRVGWVFKPGSGTTLTGVLGPYPWMLRSCLGSHDPSAVCGNSMWGVDPLADHDIDPWACVMVGYTSFAWPWPLR